jgi:RNA recognition motif-containing protein
MVLQAPNPSSVLGVFGLSIRTTERDLDEEFTRFGHVEKVTIVYDQRVGFTPVPSDHNPYLTTRLQISLTGLVALALSE